MRKRTRRGVGVGDNNYLNKEEEQIIYQGREEKKEDII